MAASSNLAPGKEENALLPGTSARPADVLITNWMGGRDTALDVTVVVSPLLNNPGMVEPTIFGRAEPSQSGSTIDLLEPS